MRFATALLLLATLSLPSQAQPRSGPGPVAGVAAPGALFAGGMARLFGDTPAFSANMQVDAKGPNGSISLPGKVSFLNGKSHFEMDATKIKGSTMPPGAVEQIKAMGMAEVHSISLPEKKEAYLIYPGLKSYSVIPVNATVADDKAEVKKTEIAKETVDGHPSTKYKVVIKGADNTQEATVWMASDLKGFPIKIQTTNEAGDSVVTFSNVNFTKPNESLFSPPADFQRYSNPTSMMQEAMMKKFGRPPTGATPPPAAAK